MPIILLISSNVICADTLNTSELSLQIEGLIQKLLQNTKVGLVVQELDTGKMLYQRNSNDAFTPASCTKLLTAAAGLLYLGEDYHYDTTLKIKGEDLNNNILKGNLYFHFTGDPTLTSSELKTLIKEIKSQGIQEIKGDIILDNTRFQGLDYGLGWIWNALWWYYSPPITTIMLNQNAVPIQLEPTQTVGEKIGAKLMNEEDKKRIQLHQNVVSVTEEEANQHCLFMVNTSLNNDINISGCWPQKSEPTTLRLALKNPNAYAKKVITEALQENGITFSGTVKEGISTKELGNLKTVALHQSKPLKDLVQTILQDSNNIYTESLTKTLGFIRFQEGSFSAGVRAIQEILKDKLKLDPTKMRLMDGSGLSRYNLIAPSQFATLLYGMHQDKTYGKTFKDALPAAGEDGTLKARFQDNTKTDKTDKKSKILAKTGSLMGVSSLSGYINTENGKDLVFSIMIDNALQDQKSLKQFEEELCNLLLKL